MDRVPGPVSERSANPVESGRGGVRPGAGRPRKSFIQDYAEAGDPPVDPLERTIWLGEVLTVALWKTMHDPEIEEAKRVQRLRQLAKDLRTLVPDQRRWQAEQKVIDFDRRMNGTPAPAEGNEELTDAEADDQQAISADSRTLRRRAVRRHAPRVQDGEGGEGRG